MAWQTRGVMHHCMVMTAEHAGDVFDIHTHNEAGNHYSALLFGGIRLLGKYDGTELWAKPGGVIIDWKANEPHGWVALADGTTILQLPKIL